jgi:hypothetical protein
MPSNDKSNEQIFCKQTLLIRVCSTFYTQRDGYREKCDFDPNGNIINLKQQNTSGFQINTLTYHEVTGKKLLSYMTDAVGTSL